MFIKTMTNHRHCFDPIFSFFLVLFYNSIYELRVQTPQEHLLQQTQEGMRPRSPWLRSPRTFRIPFQ